MQQEMEQAVLQLIKISQYAGMREDIVQAGGGNTSVKIAADRMLIKASGYQLTDISLTSGYSVVNPQVITAFLNGNRDRALSEEEGKRLLSDAVVEGKRPSIETFLHAVTDLLTLHTHPVAVNILSMRRNGMDILRELAPGALTVEYETPGIKLAQEYFSAIFKNCQNDNHVVFLKNHGMVVTGKTAEEVIGKNEEILQRIEAYLGLDMTAHHNATALWDAFSSAGQDGIVWLATDANVLRTYRAFHGLWPHSFCPDCLVYCGKQMLQISDSEEAAEAIARHVSENGPVAVVEWKNALYIHAPNVEKALEIQSVLSFSAQVMLHNRRQECDFLVEKEQDYLLHWDAEKYRQFLRR